jgi:hypothetical protein
MTESKKSPQKRVGKPLDIDEEMCEFMRKPTLHYLFKKRWHQLSKTLMELEEHPNNIRDYPCEWTIK